MITINILGGLGNQMFQYAFGYALAKKKNEILRLDTNSFDSYALRKYELGVFGIDTMLASKEEAEELKYKDENIFEILSRRIRKKERKRSEYYYKETHFYFDKNVYSLKDDTYFEGYWQSEEYFKSFRKELLEIFTLKYKLHVQSLEYQNKIVSIQSVSLHVRRGDYVTNTHTNSTHGTCSLEYYKNAVELLKKEIENPHFFIFSDDLTWAKENIDFVDNITFVELSSEVLDHEEMYLMSQCQHNIIANSSFSWWGAWLNQNMDKIVIAPKKWFNDPSMDTRDLIPADWLQV